MTKTTKQWNSKALANSARSIVKMLNEKKAFTILKAIKEWNVCVEQSGNDFLVYNFPTAGYTRKAQVIADLERCAAQLEAHFDKDAQCTTEAIVDEAVTKVVKHEVMVQDIKKGMIVMNPCLSSDLQTVVSVDDFSCYFIITFSGKMGQQYFDRGETLMVCEPKEGSQIINVIPSIKQERIMTVKYSSEAFERVLEVMALNTNVSHENLVQWLEERAQREPLADAACTLLIHACGVAIDDKLRAELVAAAQA
ncbi:TPA: hypothetical protein OUD88_002876 [Enterobacter hormaechei]|nr:hypothetical protein [Enterobacter hormaechei]